nr:hypothetical protein [uncultured Pseudodesulfovibrio sp.]
MAEKLKTWREDMLARLNAICSPSGRVPRYVAKEIIAGCAWWETHPSGPVRAPKHADRICGNEKSWCLDFGANTFLVSRAIHGCCKRMRQWIPQQRRLPISPQEMQSLNRTLQGVVRASVSNYRGDLFSSYGHNTTTKLIFGAQAICANDFIKGIAKYLKLPSLFTYQQHFPGYSTKGIKRARQKADCSEMTTCPQCGCSVAKSKLESHKRERCPKRLGGKNSSEKKRSSVKKTSILDSSGVGPGMVTCPKCKGVVKADKLKEHLTYICSHRDKSSTKKGLSLKNAKALEGKDLVACPWCGTKVKKKRLAKHQAKRCPKRPKLIG